MKAALRAEGVNWEAEADEAGTKVPHSAPAEYTHLHSTHIEPDRSDRAKHYPNGTPDLCGSADNHCSKSPGLPKQATNQAGVSPGPPKQADSQADVRPGQDKQAVPSTDREPEMIAKSASSRSQNLRMMGHGLAKLAGVHYIFVPDELGKIASETRPFTRDDFA